MTIVVNGVEFETKVKFLSVSDVIALADMEDFVVSKVIYSGSKSGSGELTVDAPVEVKNGMIFTVI